MASAEDFWLPFAAPDPAAPARSRPAEPISTRSGSSLLPQTSISGDKGAVAGRVDGVEPPLEVAALAGENGEQKEWDGVAFDAAESSSVGRSESPPAEQGRTRFEWPSTIGLRRSSALETGRASSAPSWGWREAAGRLCELAGGPASATLSCAASLALDAQQRGESVAWIQTRDSSFLPQDLHACGVDLDALVVVRAPRPADLGLAAEWIARSGAFGLVVLDLTSAVRTPMAMQARLLALAKKHDLALVCLTEKSPQQASLSSLVSLRVDTTVRRPAPARAAQRQAVSSSGQEASDEVVPPFARELAATVALDVGALSTTQGEPSRDAANREHGGDPCKRDDDRNRSAVHDVSRSAPGGELGGARPATQQTSGETVGGASGATGCGLHDLATFECEWFVAKDKRRSRPWRHIEARRGPPGLR